MIRRKGSVVKTSEQIKDRISKFRKSKVAYSTANCNELKQNIHLCLHNNLYIRKDNKLVRYCADMVYIGKVDIVYILLLRIGPNSLAEMNLFKETNSYCMNGA